MRPGAEGPVTSDAPGKFDVTVLPLTKKAPSSSRVRGPPRVAECANPDANAASDANANRAIPRVKLANGFMSGLLVSASYSTTAPWRPRYDCRGRPIQPAPKRQEGSHGPIQEVPGTPGWRGDGVRI